jgi:uncharacterized protein YdeI (YjbR/CyaY-like superfamily)
MKNTDKEEIHSKGDLPVISFDSSGKWNNWLELHHNRQEGIWLRIYKKDSGIPSINRSEALDEALCYGWIDGQANKCDEISYLQKFTPRRPRSIWSKRNIELVQRLEKEGRMKPSGLKQVEEAKNDGRWERAYDSPSKMTIPDDLINELAKDKKVLEFFEKLNKTNKFAIVWRLQTAKKPETREKRMRMIIEMLSKGEKFHG